APFRDQPDLLRGRRRREIRSTRRGPLQSSEGHASQAHALIGFVDYEATPRTQPGQVSGEVSRRDARSASSPPRNRRARRFPVPFRVICSCLRRALLSGLVSLLTRSCVATLGLAIRLPPLRCLLLTTRFALSTHASLGALLISPLLPLTI